MSTLNGRNGEVSFAVFCVCVGPEVVNATIAASEQAPGVFFAGEFRDYVTAEKRPQFSQRIKDATLCIALVGFDQDLELAIRTIERLSQIFLTRIRVVGIGHAPESRVLLRAVRAGCADFLPSPVSSTDLALALQRQQQSSIVNPQMRASTGRVVAFFGAKGGVGTTTLAVHVANYLVARHGKKTLLIDHKHQLGHVALYLGLKDTQYHFDELLKNVDRLDSELLNGFAIRHESGLDVMASPEIATAHYESKNDELERVMSFLRSEYDFIVIDSSVEYHDTKMSIISEADEVYLVATPDVAALRDLARLVEHIGLIPTANGKLSLLLNRSTANDSLSSQQIQKAVRFPVSHTIPNNYVELLRSINSGVPISTLLPTVFNRAIEGIANRVVHGEERENGMPESQPAKNTKSLLSFWR